MPDIPEDLIYIRHAGALLAFKRDEYYRAIKRGKYIRRAQATADRERKILEKAKREGGRDPY